MSYVQALGFTVILTGFAATCLCLVLFVADWVREWRRERRVRKGVERIYLWVDELAQERAVRAGLHPRSGNVNDVVPRWGSVSPKDWPSWEGSE